MDSPMVFKRFELKYLMTKQQKEAILQAMSAYMAPDKFGHSEIRNLYFDTDSFRLIRNSLERPLYKEKLRLRSYGAADAQTPVFAELKKKYTGIVYKRRISMDYTDAMDFLAGIRPLPDSQIGKEISYTLSRYGILTPKVFLSYERDAFHDPNGSSLRITFDENIRFRENDLSLAGNCCGAPILMQNQVLMEIKTSDCIPLWMARTLSELNIYKTSFSKYGNAYTQILINHRKGEYHYA